MVTRRTYLLILFLSLCSHSCQAQVKPNPCDPQPPCLPAMSGDFGFCMVWKSLPTNFPGLSDEEDLPFRILADENRENPVNYIITTRRTDTRNSFEVRFLNPGRLRWTGQNSFRGFLDAGSEDLQTLVIKVKEEKIDCCPQFVIYEILFNEKKLKRPSKSGCFVFSSPR